jgi:hypothetical protein
MKKDSKQRLFEMMGKLDSSFIPKLNEAIDINGFHLSDDELNNILKGYLEAALWTEEERLKDESQSYNDAVTNDYDDEEDESQEQIRFMEIMRNKLNTNPILSFTRESIDPNSLIQAYLDIKKFINDAGGNAVSETLDDNDEFQLGMDIWLTRNGHGAGFFDHSYDHEKELMNAARSLKEVDLYIGDDNKLHFSNTR